MSICMMVLFVVISRPGRSQHLRVGRLKNPELFPCVEYQFIEGGAVGNGKVKQEIIARHVPPAVGDLLYSVLPAPPVKPDRVNTRPRTKYGSDPDLLPYPLQHGLFQRPEDADHLADNDDLALPFPDDNRLHIGIAGLEADLARLTVKRL